LCEPLAVPFEERFWRRVDKNGPAIRVELGECWLWVAEVNTYGYGRVAFNGQGMFAHRVAWLLTHGTLPDLFVCHKCDNPRCVRPEHLFLGTARDNVIDMLAKGRCASGNARFTADQVAKIRAEFADGNVTKRELARRLSVDPRTIIDIISGKNYVITRRDRNGLRS
jgi:hypothetical protein